MPGSHHIVQANIALGRAPLTEPVMEGFVRQLEYINSVADQSPGFVWRFQTDDGDATSVQVFDNPLIIFNMSVWESVDALSEYVFRSDHRGPLKSRRTWFEKLDRPHSVLWWIPQGQQPSISDAEMKLDLLHSRGPTPAAFTYAQLYNPRGEAMRLASRMDRNCGV